MCTADSQFRLVANILQQLHYMPVVALYLAVDGKVAVLVVF